MNRSLVPALLMCLIPACLPAADVRAVNAPAADARAAIVPLPQRPDLRVDDVLDLYGTPDFAVAGILAYHGSFAGLAADVTLFIRADRLAELMFSFPTQGRTAEGLRHDADRVLKRLRVLYGPPETVLHAVREYKVHTWATSAGALLHTVVYTAGREEHGIKTQRDVVVEQ